MCKDKDQDQDQDKDKDKDKVKTCDGLVATHEKSFAMGTPMPSTTTCNHDMQRAGMVRNGAATPAYPEDAKRSLIKQRKRW